ncbi:hypothetical protein D7X96_34265 [Corallococcus interemptor]|uniref:Uncharacterized protein n=1 Tax=Corallococcus interemptor TaxID=2316720 RepID=A0A3A8PYH4_9BACT|nr:hypothetical protein [Corallococcus interemptor]RKH60091.1 hypothetical protein D7X96_34265 [Corallococcus interemptor]
MADPLDDGELAGDGDFLASFGETLLQTLDLGRWAHGLDLEDIMRTFREQIGGAMRKEDVLRAAVRQELLPLLKTGPHAPKGAGVYHATEAQLRAVHDGYLFRGNVEAVNGRAVSHDTLALGITQLGIAAVGYGGSSGTFSQRLFRKEVTFQMDDPFKQAREYIEQREVRSRKAPRNKDSLSRLATRGIRTYAERAILAERLQAEWRIGMGNPLAYELITGSGYRTLLDASLEMLANLIDRQQKFVFVTDKLEHRGFLTLGHSLDTGEYAILETLESYGQEILEGWRYDDEGLAKASRFVQRYCPQVVMGLYRASNNSPPRLFYAHQEHVHFAVRIAMADSILRPEQGYPMLLDVASMTCHSVFGEDGFQGLVQDAYAQADPSLQYLNVRKMRR